MLVINNVALEVNSSNAVYDSVTQAWLSALRMTESLLQGIPQRVNDGGILLGLSSWHSYPPLFVVTSKPTSIDHGDKSVPSWRLLTIGLRARDDERNVGLSWLLPLAHLQYYSAPVRSSRHVSQANSNITVDQLSFVVLGSFISSWLTQGLTVEAIVDALLFIGDEIFGTESGNVPSRETTPPPWLSRLITTAHTYTSTAGLAREIAIKLLHFGLRRGARFLSKDDGPTEPLFGLLSSNNILSYISNTEVKISFCRALFQLEDTIRQFPSNSKFLIRYQARDIRHVENCWEFADCPQQAAPSGKRTHDGVVKLEKRVRWITHGGNVHISDSCDGNACGCVVESSDTSHCDCVKSGHGCSPACHPRGTECRFFERLPHMFCAKPKHKDYEICQACEVRNRASDFVKSGEDCGLVPFGHLKTYGDDTFCTFSVTLDYGSEEELYKYCYGDPQDVAVFVRVDDHLRVFARQVGPLALRFDDVKRMVRSGLLDLRGFFDVLDFNHPSTHMEPLYSGFHTEDSPTEAVYKDWGSHTHNSDTIVAARNFLGGRHDSEVGNLVAMSATPLPSQDSSSCVRSISPDLTPTELERHSYVKTRRTVCPSLQHQVRAMTVVEAMHWLFSTMPGAVLSLSAFTSPLDTKRWSRGLLADPDMLKTRWRASAFAYITMVESGGHDVDVTRMESVMALAVGDSIYVAAPLVQDPSFNFRRQPIKRILGNLGRPGVSLLVPPANPRTKEVDNDSWNLVNHTPWDGKFEDNFEHVSLHLAFTEFEMPVDIGARGMRDHEVVIVEAAVQVFEKQEWISDLDILAALDNPFALFKQESHCHHPDSSCGQSDDHEQSPPPSHTNLTSVDNWAEYVEMLPSQVAIFRASRNWQARIAAVAMAPRNGYFTWVWPSENVRCRTCLSLAMRWGPHELGLSDKRQILVLL